MTRQLGLGRRAASASRRRTVSAARPVTDTEQCRRSRRSRQFVRRGQPGWCAGRSDTQARGQARAGGLQYWHVGSGPPARSEGPLSAHAKPGDFKFTQLALVQAQAQPVRPARSHLHPGPDGARNRMSYSPCRWAAPGGTARYKQLLRALKLNKQPFQYSNGRNSALWPESLAELLNKSDSLSCTFWESEELPAVLFGPGIVAGRPISVTGSLRPAPRRLEQGPGPMQWSRLSEDMRAQPFRAV